MKCEKCGYARTMGETAPDWQCPSCGVACAKASASENRPGRARRAQLTQAGIPFVEYFLDEDQVRFDELIEKLKAAGHRGGGIGTPSFDVNSGLLFDDPSLDTLRKHL